MSPRTVQGWCRHCGVEGPLTMEHLPPRSARNRGWVHERRGPFDGRATDDLAQWMEGHARRALCETCQHNPPEWGYPVEYIRWRSVVSAVLETRVAAGAAITQGELIEVELPYDLMPGRFARMVVGMVLSALDDPAIIGESPDLAELIGAGLPRGSAPPEGGSIGPWRLLLALADEKWAFSTRLAPAPRGGQVLAFVDPPFVFYLHRGPEPPRPDEGTDITEWLAFRHHDRLDGRRSSWRRVRLPFRFGAWDFAELQYFLYLGLLNAIVTGSALPDEAEAELVRLERWGVVRRSRGAWELTEEGSRELASAPLLSHRWTRPSSGP